jgi:hypothetical protein
MKTLLIILFTLTLSTCFSQSDEILLKCKSFPKGTNVITINTKDTVNIAFKKIAGIILDYGFTIANSDKELYYINTDFVTIGSYTFKTKISVRLKPKTNGGTSIILKGESTNSGYSFPAYNYHRKDVPNRAFAHMLAIASKYEDVEILASTEQ